MDTLKKLLSKEDAKKLDEGDLMPLLKALKKTMGAEELKKVRGTFDEYIKLAKGDKKKKKKG